jgi:hypothetical protein
MKILNPIDWEKLRDANGRTGFSISELYRLCITEEIVSVNILKPGKKKGLRLIKRESLDAYISSFLPGGSRYQKAQTAEAKSTTAS